jgi:hypothetical protein
MNTATASPHNEPDHPHTDHEIDPEMARAAVSRLKMGWGQKAVVALLLTVVIIPPLAGFYSYFTHVPLHLLASQKEAEGADESDEPDSVTLVSDRAHTVELSDDVVKTLGIKKGAKYSDATARVARLHRLQPQSPRTHPRSIRARPSG